MIIVNVCPQTEMENSRRMRNLEPNIGRNGCAVDNDSGHNRGVWQPKRQMELEFDWFSRLDDITFHLERDDRGIIRLFDLTCIAVDSLINTTLRNV